MNSKQLAKQILPPFLVNLAYWMKQKMRPIPPEWEYIPQGWRYADNHPEVKGWNVDDILAVYRQKWPGFANHVGGTGMLGIAHEGNITIDNDIYAHNASLSFAYVLALTARQQQTISLLDWGGGIGHYYLLAKSVLPQVNINYHCKDVPVLAEYGQTLFPNQHFYTDDQCLNRRYDLVMASTSLHYTPDWQNLIKRLAGVANRYLYIAQLPTIFKQNSFVFVQRCYNYNYNTEYLGWCLNRQEFLQVAAEANLTLIREFTYGYRPIIHKAPEQNEYRGFLFGV